MEIPRVAHTEHDLAQAGLLRSMDLDPLKKYKIRDLDGDARLRLRIGLMALQGARVLVFDNPTEGLVAQARESLWNMITSFRSTHSVLICTDDVAVASRFADRVVAMENGHVRCAGTPLYLMNLYGRSYTLTIKLLHGSKHEDFNIFVSNNLPKAKLHSVIGFCLIYSVPIGIEIELTKFLDKIEKMKRDLNINYFVISIPTLNDIYKRACSISKGPSMRAYDKTKLTEMKKKKDMALLLVKNKHIWERLEGKELRKCTFKTFMDKTILYRRRRSNFFLFFVYTLAFSIPFIVPESISFALKDDFVLVNTSEPYTIDAIDYHNTLTVRTNEVDEAKRIGVLYSCTLPEQMNLDLIVIPEKERMGRYLKFLAVDEPLKYATAFAFSLDVNVTKDTIFLNAMYSITTNDHTTAPKTLNKATSTLYKFLTKNSGNSIVIYNEPIAIKPIRLLDNDLFHDVTFIPLIILIVTAIHASLSSEEHGLPRTIQLLSGDRYSPLFYWITFYVFDLCGYLAMIVLFVILITMVFAFKKLIVEFGFVEYTALSLLFITYGLCEIPLSYLFQRLSKEGPLNTMLFIVANFVFSQGILIMQNFYVDTSFFYTLLNLHPHFNFAYGFSKFRVIHSFNGACDRFLEAKNCSNVFFHPCCPTCTVFNACFKKKEYLTYQTEVDNPGIARELTASFLCSFLFFGLILLVEYRYLPRVWYYILNHFVFPGRLPTKDIDISTIIEKTDVEDEWKAIKKNTEGVPKWDPRGGLLIRSLWVKKNGCEPTLRDINLKVPLGETIAISDPDIEGRHFLMRTLARIGPTPLAGDVLLQGNYNLVKGLPHVNRCIGYCSKENTFVSWLTVKENIELMARLRGVPMKYIEVEVNKWIHALELNEDCDVPSKNLDPVSCRKLCLALALVGDPPLILLDEPTYGMDSVAKLHAFSVLALVQATEHIILYGTLSMEEVQALCDRIAVIVHGKVICISDLDQLIKRYCNGYIVVVELNLDQSGDNFTEILKRIEEKFGSVDINDLTDNFINFQIFDRDLSWSDAFIKMEDLKKDDKNIISYIITSTTLEEIFRNLVSLRHNEKALKLPPICFPRQRRRYKEMVGTQNSESDQANIDACLGNYYDLRNMSNIAWKGIFSTSE